MEAIELLLQSLELCNQAFVFICILTSSRLVLTALRRVLLLTLFMLLLITARIYGAWFLFDRAFDFDAPLWSRDSSIDIALPRWPAKLLVPLSLGILWLRLCLQLWAYGRAFRLNETRPVGVPLIEDAATQANKEAKSVEGADG